MRVRVNGGVLYSVCSSLCELGLVMLLFSVAEGSIISVSSVQTSGGGDILWWRA